MPYKNSSETNCEKGYYASESAYDQCMEYNSLIGDKLYVAKTPTASECYPTYGIPSKNGKKAVCATDETNSCFVTSSSGQRVRGLMNTTGFPGCCNENVDPSCIMSSSEVKAWKKGNVSVYDLKFSPDGNYFYPPPDYTLSDKLKQKQTVTKSVEKSTVASSPPPPPPPPPPPSTSVPSSVAVYVKPVSKPKPRRAWWTYFNPWYREKSTFGYSQTNVIGIILLILLALAVLMYLNNRKVAKVVNNTLFGRKK
jgi:hypothetical protein